MIYFYLLFYFLNLVTFWVSTGPRSGPKIFSRRTRMLLAHRVTKCFFYYKLYSRIVPLSFSRISHFVSGPVSSIFLRLLRVQLITFNLNKSTKSNNPIKSYRFLSRKNSKICQFALSEDPVIQSQRPQPFGINGIESPIKSIFSKTAPGAILQIPNLETRDHP